MKKALSIIISAIILFSVYAPLLSFAAESATEEINNNPVLNSISFKNAVIEESFSPYTYEYGIMLEDPTVTPTLEDYEINGEANIFVTYNLDETKHQTGIIVTLQFENGSTIYTFNYINALPYNVNSNNLLAQASCRLGEIYPEINDKDTEYKLYIPNDLTELNLSAATQNVSAHCDIPGTITLKSDQEPTISVTVTASDASTRTYNFKIKRLNKTSAQVIKEMADPDFTSLVEGELFYKQPEFFIIIVSSAAGILILSILVLITKRFTLKVTDKEETEFYDYK